MRTALDLDAATPVVLCDVRDRASCKEILLYALEAARARAAAADPGPTDADRGAVHAS
ncbi:hypothetical protein [Streptomyces sp. NPDC046985]|uniref:hypothetical protein n=1 Tax=Streptomyces sp. NPDC046985 TaxID=3155377 RepID=UPI0033F116AE